MFKHVLIATDGSKLSDKAVKSGLKLAGSLGAKVTAYRAIPDESRVYIEGELSLPRELRTRLGRDLRAAVESEMDKVRKQAAAANIACSIVIGKTYAPWKGIVETAGAKGCDVIVMASHGRGGIGTIMMGSVTQKVLSVSKLPVLVFR